ncbi:sigma-70 family RNA polymerase sigma factor [Pseudonocardia nigra]|uniref:sigma-70 family RNA polymerase sigma factor n=1 Tax=Pseudonocardia nigra TaxID=1921578 RepID=UPI001C5E734C|nr:sigma-70 family RNA polymerase sigma factor [Pseudonocardia nigra]
MTGRRATGEQDRPSDLELLLRLNRGDKDALSIVYDRYSRQAWSLAHRICRDPGFAHDVVQDVFLVLWKQPTRYDPGRAPFVTWLLTLVHHRAVDLVRREDAWQRQSARSSASPHPGADEFVVSHLLAGSVREALRGLPEHQRRALTLAYYAGYTQREIAQCTGVPLGTVKSRMVSGIARLRVLLDHETAGPNRRADA